MSRPSSGGEGSSEGDVYADEKVKESYNRPNREEETSKNPVSDKEVGTRNVSDS